MKFSLKNFSIQCCGFKLAAKRNNWLNCLQIP